MGQSAYWKARVPRRTGGARAAIAGIQAASRRLSQRRVSAESLMRFAIGLELEVVIRVRALGLPLPVELDCLEAQAVPWERKRSLQALTRQNPKDSKKEREDGRS